MKISCMPAAVATTAALLLCTFGASETREARAQDAKVYGGGSGAQRPYVFTQVHQDDLPWWQGNWKPQQVPAGAKVQVQLPGIPTVWNLSTEPCEPTLCKSCTRSGSAALVSAGHRTVIPNPNRVPGTQAIYQFDFEAQGAGLAAVCLTANPPTPLAGAAGAKLGSSTAYKLSLQIVEQ